DDRCSRVGTHRAGDLLRGDLDTVASGVLGKDDFLDVLVEHRAGHFRSELSEVGAAVALEITLEVADGDHPLANTDDHVRRDGRGSGYGAWGARERRGSDRAPDVCDRRSRPTCRRCTGVARTSRSSWDGDGV